MPRTRDDRGFTLIELLVVMIIIGILAAIAVPVFLTQRQKARDTATKSDVTSVGKEIQTYYVDGSGTLTGAVASGVYTLKEGTTTVATVKLSSGTTFTADTTQTAAIMYLTGGTCTNATGWVISLSNPDGQTKTWYYSAQGGLSSTRPSACA